MSYEEKINRLLVPKKIKKYTVLDLFAGCGGLSLGFEANNFKTTGYEMNPDACATYSQNLIGDCKNVKLSNSYDFPSADVLLGGPPCQPFSVNGNQLGLNDVRNGFPICISAVQKTQPKLFLFENVKGLLYRNKWYLENVISELECMGYTVKAELLNAKYFEVPQNRERVFIVGYKKGEFVFPKEKSKIITAGDALGSMAGKSPKGSRFLNAKMNEYIRKYEIASKCTTARDLHLDKPARTLTCRNLAGSTGDMHRLKMPSGRRRRLNYIEAMRLQSFPDTYRFCGNETSVFNQIGNAVPPMMSYHIAKAVKKYLNEYHNIARVVKK